MAEAEAEAEDARREAALACTPLFQPNFRPSKATQAQLDKLKVTILFSSSFWSSSRRRFLGSFARIAPTPMGGSSQRRGKICEEHTDVKNSTNSSASSADGSSSVSTLEQRSCLNFSRLKMKSLPELSTRSLDYEMSVRVCPLSSSHVVDPEQHPDILSSKIFVHSEKENSVLNLWSIAFTKVFSLHSIFSSTLVKMAVSP
ncbi:PP2Cc, partial [Musa troglodytarum]